MRFMLNSGAEKKKVQVLFANILKVGMSWNRN